MTSEQWDRICRVLDRALERPPDERRDWLDTACADEPVVREEVESLLDAYEPDDPLFGGAEGFPTAWFDAADSPQADRGRSAAAPPPAAGTTVGAYRLGFPPTPILWAYCCTSS